MNEDFIKNNHLTLIQNERFVVKLMYATKENITTVPVYQDFGFSPTDAYIHIDAYEALLKLVPILKKEKLKLKIFDAYRTPEAHQRLHDLVSLPHFFASCPELSQHCHGIALDVCLCDENGKDLSYPTTVDCYTPLFAQELQAGNIQNFVNKLQHARHDYQEVSLEEMYNREYLKNLMENAGFVSLMHEWWHYNLPENIIYSVINID